MTTLSKPRVPEYYEKTGCQFSPSCFRDREPICPFPQCIEDKGGVRAAKKALLKEEVIKLRDDGVKVNDIVVRLNLSQKQIYYLLKKQEVK